MYKYTEIFDKKYWDYCKKYNPQIKANCEPNDIAVEITTTNLQIKNLVEGDITELHEKLWGDHELMELYGEGIPRSFDDVKERMQYFLESWRTKNPFSCFVARDKGANLVGAVLFTDYMDVYGDSSYPNSSYLSYITASAFQGRGLSREYIGAIVYGWSKYILDKGFSLKGKRDFVEILATCTPENIKSTRILQDFGFSICGKGEKFGNDKDFYTLPILDQSNNITSN